MADVYLTFKIMPTGPDVDLEAINTKATELAENFGGKIAKSEQAEVAFGLKALMLTMIMDEDKGSTENLEKEFAAVENVNSVDVVDVRRAIG